MHRTSTPRTRRHAACLLPALLALALAACGGAAQDDDATIPPIPAAHAGEASDVAAGTAPLDVNRHVPGGVFSWRIEIGGQVEKRPNKADSRARHLARVHRVVEGTARMRGGLGNGDLASVNPELHPQVEPKASPDMQDPAGTLESCGDDDEACRLAAVMKMASNPEGRAAMQASADDTLARLGRIDFWFAESCTATVHVDDLDDTTAWVEDYGEGYNDSRWVTTVTKWQGDRQVSCQRDPFDHSTDATLVYLDTQAHLADLTFGKLEVATDVSVNGKPAQPRTVTIPHLAIAAQPAAPEGLPFHGEATLDIGASRDPPLTARLSWRFEPDSR